MTEAIVQAQPAADGPVSRLLGFYAAGSRSEAGKLTLAIIEESAKHLKLAPKIDLRLVKTTEMVRVGWLRLVSENENEEVAEQFAARWKEAFAGARRARVTENIEAELASEARGYRHHLDEWKRFCEPLREGHRAQLSGPGAEADRAS